jgi:hypothetical protein
MREERRERGEKKRGRRKGGSWGLHFLKATVVKDFLV